MRNTLKINEDTVRKLFLYLNLTICFLLPMNGKLFQVMGLSWKVNLLSPVLLLAFVLGFFTPTFNWKKVKQNQFFRLFLILFLLYFASALWYVPLSDALGVVGKKIGLVAIPITLFGNAAFYVRRAKKLYLAFAAGVVFSVLCMDVQGLFYWDRIGSFPYYVDYCRVLHPAYFGLNLVLLLVLSLHRFSIQQITKRNVLYQFFMLFFVIGHMFLLVSKGVLITATVVIIVYLFVYFRTNLKKAALYSAFWAVPFIGLTLSPMGLQGLKSMLIERFSDLAKLESNNRSTSFRAAIIKKSPELLEDDWILGVGHGNETLHLNSFYEKNNWVYARHYSLNTHNQFLQTWLGLGVVGLFIILVMMLGPFVMPISAAGKLILFAFVFLFCTEAMLERQAGIVLFMYFYCLFVGLTRSKQSRDRKRLLTFT